MILCQDVILVFLIINVQNIMNGKKKLKGISKKGSYVCTGCVWGLINYWKVYRQYSCCLWHSISYLYIHDLLACHSKKNLVNIVNDK